MIASWFQYVCNNVHFSGELLGVSGLPGISKDGVRAKRENISKNYRKLFSHLVRTAFSHLHERVLDSTQDHQEAKRAEPTQDRTPYQVNIIYWSYKADEVREKFYFQCKFQDQHYFSLVTRCRRMKL